MHFTTLSIISSNYDLESFASFEGKSFLWYNFSIILENYKMHSSYLLIKFIGAIQDMQQTISYFNALLSWSLEIILLNRICNLVENVIFLMQIYLGGCSQFNSGYWQTDVFTKNINLDKLICSCCYLYNFI